MSSKGQPFNNDSGDKNVGVTDPDADNTQPLAMERMDKPKHDVGQTGASNDESKERSEKKAVSPDEERERNIIKLTATFDQLEMENKELKQCVFKTIQELSQEIKNNREDLKAVINDKIRAVSISAAAEEVIEQQRGVIEEKTRQISSLEDSIKRLEQQAGEREKTIKAQRERISLLMKQMSERDTTISRQQSSVKNLKKDLDESNLTLRNLQSNEKTLQNTLTLTKNELTQTKDRYSKHFKEMDALKLSFGQECCRIQVDSHALRKQLYDSQDDARRLTLRLSKIAGADLAYQNPNIADLGDPNRPTKLSERFSELYDNQWTDAFEQIDLQDAEEKIKRLYAILKKIDGHCLDVCRNYDAAVKESLTHLTVTRKIKILKPERTQEAENDTGSPSQNDFKIPSEKDTTLPLPEESKEEMTGSVGLCNTYMWHKKEIEKCISPESMTESECTRHVSAAGNKEGKGAEEKDEGKGSKTEGKLESGSIKQTGRFKAKKKIEGDLSDKNNEYNPDVKAVNGSSEAAPEIKKDTQELEDDTDCKKIDNRAEKERSHVELAYQNDKSAETKSDFKTEGNECTDDISQHDVESKEEKQTKQDEQKENVIYLKFDFDSLTNSHKQTISEIRRIVYTQLEDQVVKAISQAVLEEMELPRETGVVSYVEECAKICWLARLHDPPVHIEFEKIEDDSPFKVEMYKAYTKTGRRLDYVVWPPVFQHKNGPMLSKGVAQGK